MMMDWSLFTVSIFSIFILAILYFKRRKMSYVYFVISYASLGLYYALSNMDLTFFSLKLFSCIYFAFSMYSLYGRVRKWMFYLSFIVLAIFVSTEFISLYIPLFCSIFVLLLFFIISLKNNNFERIKIIFINTILLCSCIIELVIVLFELTQFSLVNDLLIIIIAVYAMLVLQLMLAKIVSASQSDAVSDPLTGLYNRRIFLSMFTRFSKRVSKLYLAFIDLDNFKKLNDTQGHDKGDQALKSIAKILTDEVGSKGIVARYGGEEMVILISQDIKADEYFEKLRQRIEGESEPSVTASIGVAIWEPHLSIEECLTHADAAMYHSKTTGKNKVTIHRGN